MEQIRWQVTSPEGMRALGRLWGQSAGGGEVFLLRGPLGAGKTVWVKGLGEGLGVTDIINSPTFTIVKPYEGRLRLIHIDLYRLGSEEDCADLAIEDLMGEGAVLAMEWADHFPSFQPDSRCEVEIEIARVETERSVTMNFLAPENAAWSADLCQESTALEGVTLR